MSEKLNLAQQLYDHRQTLNSIPELGRSEFETSKYIN